MSDRAGLVIAIDGIAGAGKSTLAAALAERLGLEYLDTGAMYRAVALAAVQRGVSPSDGPGLSEIAATISLEVGKRVLLDGRDVTGAIRSAEVDATVSEVAAHPGVREALVERQRQWAAVRDGAVVEGRDMATVVFPDAQLKLFLVADLQVRGERRFAQSAAEPAPGAVAAALARRDEYDSNRQAAPLRPAPGAKVLDTTNASVAELVDQVLGWL